MAIRDTENSPGPNSVEMLIADWNVPTPISPGVPTGNKKAPTLNSRGPSSMILV